MNNSDNSKEALYATAVAHVIKTKKVSIASIQRLLKIGYNRAAIMLEKMEENGIISPILPDGTRKVL